MQDLQHNSSMQHKPDTTMIFPFDPFDRMEIGTTFIGTEIFPAVLHSLLDEVEERGYSHIVSWQPHGRCFAVHNRKEFVQLIMPVYFRMSKFASFQRQLNIYGFKCITAGPDKGGYHHDNFVRGQKRLCKYIGRQCLKAPVTRKPVPGTKPGDYRLGMVRFAKAEKMLMGGRQGDNTSSACSSDLMMNARVSQSKSRTYPMPTASMFTNTLRTKTGFSNDNAGARRNQVHTRTAFAQCCNNSSVPTFSRARLFKAHPAEPDCHNTGNESAVSTLCPPRFATCEEMERPLHASYPEPKGYISNQSVVSMLFPSWCLGWDERERMLDMSNCVQPQSIANEQSAQAYPGAFDDHPGFESFSTAFFQDAVADASVTDEPIGVTYNNTFFNHFGSMPQNAYHRA